MHLTSRSRPLAPTDFTHFDYIIGLSHRMCSPKQCLMLRKSAAASTRIHDAWCAAQAWTT